MPGFCLEHLCYLHHNMEYYELISEKRDCNQIKHQSRIFNSVQSSQVTGIGHETEIKAGSITGTT